MLFSERNNENRQKSNCVKILWQWFHLNFFTCLVLIYCIITIQDWTVSLFFSVNAGAYFSIFRNSVDNLKFPLSKCEQIWNASFYILSVTFSPVNYFWILHEFVFMYGVQLLSTRQPVLWTAAPYDNFIVCLKI